MPAHPTPGPDPLGRTTYTYDALGRVTSVRGPRGPVTYTLYDADGRPLDPDGDPPAAPDADPPPDEPHVIG